MHMLVWTHGSSPAFTYCCRNDYNQLKIQTYFLLPKESGFHVKRIRNQMQSARNNLASDEFHSIVSLKHGREHWDTTVSKVHVSHGAKAM